jgi:hypothetical protein
MLGLLWVVEGCVTDSVTRMQDGVSLSGSARLKTVCEVDDAAQRMIQDTIDDPQITHQEKAAILGGNALASSS